MRRWLVLFVFLVGAVPSSAQSLEDGGSPPIRRIQVDSLVGLEKVHLRTLTWTYPVKPEVLHPIVSEKLMPAGVQIASAAEGLVADPPFLRVSYEVKTRTLDDRTVAMYWVSLELVQAVNWTWDVDWLHRGTAGNQATAGGLAVTWSAMHADVASDPETAALEIPRQVAILGGQLAAQIQAANPVVQSFAMTVGADGHRKCESETLKPKRRPKAESP